MSTFIKLRLILQEPKPDFARFQVDLERQEIQKGDLDLLLRKAVESKLPQFADFVNALVRYTQFYPQQGGQHQLLRFQRYNLIYSGTSQLTQVKRDRIRYSSFQIDHVSNLMLACEKGNCAMVEALLRYKQLDILHRDQRKLHAGFYAVENKSREDSEGILRLLIQREPAMVSQQLSRYSEVDLGIWKRKQVNQEAGNQTLLIAAIRKGKVELVKLLLDQGADPNWQVPDTGNTSLHDAVKQLKSKLSKAMSEIIRMLLLKGGDSLRKNKQQKTVYDYAEKALADYQRIEDSVNEQLQQEQQKVIVLCSLNTESQLQGLMHQAQILFSQYEGESEEEESFLPEGQIQNGLTEEIISFQKQCMAEHQTAKRDIQPFLNKLDKIIQPQGLTIDIYGSFATGLWVKQSNIDIQLIRKDPFDSSSPKEILEHALEGLKRLPCCRSITFLNRSSRVILRAQIEGGRGRILHISVAERNQSGRAVVAFIKEQMQLYHELRPMFFVIKSLCCQFRLSQPKSGGLRTYALVIMLLSCISKWNSSDLGKLLIDFLFYFGFYYDYLHERREQADSLDEYVIALQIIDPLNPNNDLAKHARAYDLQRMFRAAYIALHSNVGSGRLRMMFDTKKILL